MATSVLRVPEVAAHLRIGRTSVYRLIASRELPSIKIGATRLVTSTALEQYIASLEEGTENA